MGDEKENILEVPELQIKFVEEGETPVIMIVVATSGELVAKDEHPENVPEPISKFKESPERAVVARVEAVAEGRVLQGEAEDPHDAEGETVERMMTVTVAQSLEDIRRRTINSILFLR